MRNVLGRHLACMWTGTEWASPRARWKEAPPEFSWRGHLGLLLFAAAEVEHSLMVEYLFAAYSLGGPSVRDQDAARVRRWQETILGIAKEEMGHLLTVQNLLKAIGAPLNFGREEFPWGAEFYPFDFELEPLTLDSLAKYVCAESPPGWSGAEASRIRKRANAAAGRPVNRVGEIYDRMAGIVRRPSLLPGTAFLEGSVNSQASRDEWARGYAAGAGRRVVGNVSGVDAPQLFILPVKDRQTALEALRKVGEQGEGIKRNPGPAAPPGRPRGKKQPSHFERFLGIYRELSALSPAAQKRAVRPVATNPKTWDAGRPQSSVPGRSRPSEANVITDEGAVALAHLFNVRYRMLLVNLTHAFRVPRPAVIDDAQGPRGLLIHLTFGEMYNLRAIAGLLVNQPLRKGNRRGLRAGPPFEFPYTLHLPEGEPARWLYQLDLYEAARLAAREASEYAPPADRPFLDALRASDRAAVEQIHQLIPRSADDGAGRS